MALIGISHAGENGVPQERAPSAPVAVRLEERIGAAGFLNDDRLAEIENVLQLAVSRAAQTIDAEDSVIRAGLLFIHVLRWEQRHRLGGGDDRNAGYLALENVRLNDGEIVAQIAGLQFHDIRLRLESKDHGVGNVSETALGISERGHVRDAI